MDIFANVGGRPKEYETQEEADAMKKAYNDARQNKKTGKWNTNKKHKCPHCEKELYKHTILPHIIKFHKDELKKRLMPYAKITNPQSPFGTLGFYPCLVCEGLWDKPGFYHAHLKRHPECTVDAQLKAIYNLIGTHPAAQVINVTQSNYITARTSQNVSRDLRAENKILYKKIEEVPRNLRRTLEETHHLTMETLSAKLHALELEISDLRNAKCRLENRVDFLEVKASITYENLQDKIECLITYIKEQDRKRQYSNMITEVLNRDIDIGEYNRLFNMALCAGLDLKKEPNHVIFKIAAEEGEVGEVGEVHVEEEEEHVEEEEEHVEEEEEHVEEEEEHVEHAEIRVSEVEKLTPVLEHPLTPPKMPTQKPVESNKIVTEHDTSKKHCKMCGGTEEYYDLNACSQCDGLCCVDNPIRGCYTLDCDKCEALVCHACVIKNGANRRKPKCKKCITSPD